MTESAAQERIYVLENYLVAFLDVLGQSNKFDNCDCQKPQKNMRQFKKR